MAVPRNRMSNARKNSKRAHHAKKPKHLSDMSELWGFLTVPTLVVKLVELCGGQLYWGKTLRGK